MLHSLQDASERASDDPFATEEEIKILERRLQLLREGLSPLGGDSKAGVPETPRQQESREIAEGAAKGELPVAAPPMSDDAIVPPPSAKNVARETDISELKTFESDKQIKALVELAFERSVQDAVDVARRLEDAYLLDEFHDTLVDDEKLRTSLVELGKLENM